MIKFTDNYIKNLHQEKNWFEQTEATGLAVRVLPSGHKSWIYRFTLNNKRYKMTLGKYPGISLKQARDLHQQAESLKDQGINPIEQNAQDKLKLNHTLQNLILSWYANYIEKNRKQPGQIKQMIDADIIPLLGDQLLEKIQARDISKALDLIVKRGAPVHANKVLSTLKQAFNYATSRGEMVTNPAVNIRARDIGGIEKPRERFLSLEEIQKLWLFLDSNASKLYFHVKIAIKIILLTGVRTAELRLAQWDEFDFEQSQWTIPAKHTKSGMMMKIHLSPQTKALLDELNRHSISCYVLPGLKDCQPLTDKVLPRAINRIQERLGIPQWTAHDLRRTFATQLGEALHVDPVVIEKCLGHKMPKIMATYNKNEMLPQRKEALERWGKYIESLLCDNVQPLSMENVNANPTAIRSAAL
ncbi:MAG: tyrosine-type recombinase/integrase [Gammaproteobacteria bacterium]|nr:tyrosine-type recombinase/integrase [Gammaproteobacteria bacterium]